MYSLVGRGLFRGEGGEAAQPWPPSLLDQAFPAPPLTKEPKSGMNLEQDLDKQKLRKCLKHVMNLQNKPGLLNLF